mgnify:CR=1 FL=1
MKKYRLLSILAFVLFSFSANAQANPRWLENTMFSSGKINVVVAVVSVVFILLVIYLVSLDRKLSKMEKDELNNSK